MEMIKGINYNWYSSAENGEEFTTRTVGRVYNDVECTKITEHPAYGEGDKWYYDIHYSDGSFNRVFNPNEVFFNSPDGGK